MLLIKVHTLVTPRNFIPIGDDGKPKRKFQLGSARRKNTRRRRRRRRDKSKDEKRSLNPAPTTARPKPRRRKKKASRGSAADVFILRLDGPRATRATATQEKNRLSNFNSLKCKRARKEPVLWEETSRYFLCIFYTKNAAYNEKNIPNK